MFRYIRELTKTDTCKGEWRLYPQELTKFPIIIIIIKKMRRGRRGQTNHGRARSLFCSPGIDAKSKGRGVHALRSRRRWASKWSPRRPCHVEEMPACGPTAPHFQNPCTDLVRCVGSWFGVRFSTFICYIDVDLSSRVRPTRYGANIFSAGPKIPLGLHLTRQLFFKNITLKF